MKRLLIFVAVVSMASALSEEFVAKIMEKLTDISAGCIEETHATDDDVAELIARILPPTSHEGKCMIFCFNKKFNVQRADGSVDKVGAVMALEPLKAEDPELYKQVLQVGVTCGEKVEMDSDPCITASNLAMCVRNEAKTAGIDETAIMG